MLKAYCSVCQCIPKATTPPGAGGEVPDRGCCVFRRFLTGIDLENTQKQKEKNENKLYFQHSEATLQAFASLIFILRFSHTCVFIKIGNRSYTAFSFDSIS